MTPRSSRPAPHSAESEPIEIKVNIAGDVDHAIDVLSLQDGKDREIYFLEDLTPGLPTSHPLLAAGVVLRLRREADGDGDATVKLRPCRRSQLTSEWSTPAEKDGGLEYRIEGDWAGPRRVLAASLVQELTADQLEQGLRDPGCAFISRQQEFLAACAPIRINPSALNVLGPILATRWTKITIGSVTKVTAERWRVGPLDFLELSLRVDRSEAPRALAELTLAVVRAGLQVDPGTRAKTDQVLDVIIEA